jgi:DNA-binding response OmpR family regulator
LRRVQSQPLILIVDDEAYLARAIARSLEHSGFATRCALSGVEARALAPG